MPDSDVSGQIAAVIYTLSGTARLNAINPVLYLRHVLERIADHPSTRIDKLLYGSSRLSCGPHGRSPSHRPQKSEA